MTLLLRKPSQRDATLYQPDSAKADLQLSVSSLRSNANPANFMITVTDNAVKHLRQLLEAKSTDDGTGLRLLVNRGGCAGMEYVMKMDVPATADHVFGQSGVTVIVDPESLQFLNGSAIDYQDDLNDVGFKVINPNAARSCGCGSSFEPKDLS